MQERSSIFVNSCYGYSKCVTVSEASVRVSGIRKWGLGEKQLIATAKTLFTATNQRRFSPKCKTCSPSNNHTEKCFVCTSILRSWTIWVLQKQHFWTTLPIGVPDNVALAPPEILKLIKCSCDSETPCRTKRCGCVSSGLPSTVFCVCMLNDCLNANKKVKEDEDDELIDLAWI